MSKYSDEVDFEAIKRTVSLSEILARYTRVPNRQKYRIPCILHGGDGYNLAIDEERGLWHCFTNCGGGDVITLYARLENLTTIDAARRLSVEYSVKATGTARNFREVLNDSRSWEPKAPLPEIELPHNKPLWYSYRDFSPEATKNYELVWAVEPAGILTPFRDLSGRLVGYAIRQIVLEPKYLNSTGLKKSEFLYGLYQNLDAVKRHRYAIICEGQFSAVRVWDYGYKNVVATLSADMSPTQANLLVPYVDKIVVLYDGDKAGRLGATKIKESYSALYKIQIIFLPEGFDPDNVENLREILNENQ